MRAPLLLLPALLFAFASCDRDAQATDTEQAATEKGGEIGCLGDCSEENEAQNATAAAVDVEKLVQKADPTGVYGKGVTLEEFTKISDILAKPEEFEGKRVLIKGEAVGVCAHKGCWVDLKSDEPFQSIQVKVEDGEIVFPISCKGTEVIAEGVVEKLVRTVEQHRAYLAKKAEEKGEEFDPESVTEPMIIWRIKGLGAKIEG